MQARLILLASGGLLFGTLLMAYGVLLAFRPDLFLRFHDFLNPGSRWNRGAEWRKNVYNFDYKVLAAGFLLVGLFIVIVMLRRLMSG